MASDELPSDTIFEIISRTPSLKALDSCKTVCKDWKEMIYEANFMPTYCKRTKSVSGYFVQDMKHNVYFSQFVSFDDDDHDHDHDRQGNRLTSSLSSSRLSVGRLPDNMRILGSCRQGILCCVRREHHNKYRYYACKPTTGQWQPLPNPRRHFDTVAVAIMVLRSSPFRYKIVRLSNLSEQESLRNHYSYRCDMFDSKTWKWRRLGNVNLSHYELIRYSNQSPSVTAANSIYWLTSHDNVVEFREADESCHKFALPKLVQNNAAYRSKQLIEYEGGLGLVCVREEDNSFELWLKEIDSINNRTVITWRKKMEVDVERVEKYGFPVGFYNAGIVLLKAYHEVVFYKFQDSTSSRVKLDGPRVADEVFPFRSDFERVNLGRGWEKETLTRLLYE